MILTGIMFALLYWSIFEADAHTDRWEYQPTRWTRVWWAFAFGCVMWFLGTVLHVIGP